MRTGTEKSLRQGDGTKRSPIPSRTVALTARRSLANEAERRVIRTRLHSIARGNTGNERGFAAILQEYIPRNGSISRIQDDRPPLSGQILAEKGPLAIRSNLQTGCPTIHAQQLEVFQSMRPIDPKEYIRGQYEGYLDVDGVAKGSTTETFVALKIHIDSWRWAGVPFFVRAGKSMSDTATEAIVVFRRPPLQLFNEKGCPEPERNRLRFRLGHNDGVQMQVQALDPSSTMASKAVTLNVDFSDALGEEKLPYEQLLGDALDGNSTRFATQKIIEGTWTALAPILENPGEVHTYKPGTMGPEISKDMIKEYGGWIEPIGSASDRPA